MTAARLEEIARFHEGRHHRLWELLGAHQGEAGVRFSVWAPHAQQVSVVGDWNGWTPGVDDLARVGDTGVWETTVSAHRGDRYKLAITDVEGATSLRADPMAAWAEDDGTASRVFTSAHPWDDAAWMAARRHLDPVRMRFSAYEVHLGSWRRGPDGRRLTYCELAPRLADHVEGLGFTHVELLPVAEHPYEPSWGYQVTGFFAPTARYGDPDDFRAFVDHLHQRGIGVIVDWVAAHFPQDAWALGRFDGTALYEHTDPLRAEHPDWGTFEMDHTKPEVRDFLVSNALFWLDELHCDGLRVDAVASMLYLDYSRGPEQWQPNERGGNEDLDAVAFLQEANSVIHRDLDGVLTIAEESTAWDGVSRPAEDGGLGFSHKWNMGWMHDTLAYWSTPPEGRPERHRNLTFGFTYAWAEHFVLPLSHDEVVHLKKPLIGKMPGATDQERFAHLRSLYGWMWGHPGKQLLFMGGELAEEHEWSHDRELDWARLDQPLPAGVSRLLRALNRLQADHPALHETDGDPHGFAWLLVDDADHATLAFQRVLPDDAVVVVANLSDTDRTELRVGLPCGGRWSTALTTDHVDFGGATATTAELLVEPTPWQGAPCSTLVSVPARTVVFLAPRSLS